MASMFTTPTKNPQLSAQNASNGTTTTSTTLNPTTPSSPSYLKVNDNKRNHNSPFSRSSLESSATTLHSPVVGHTTDRDHGSALTSIKTAQDQHTPAATSGDESGSLYSPETHHPFSAFYSHPTTRTSLEQMKSCSTLNVHNLDALYSLESGKYPLGDVPSQQRTTATKRFSSVWPSTIHPRCNRTNTSGRPSIRDSRLCAPYRRLTAKQRLVLQILIALFVIGAATGLGIGISKAVGAGVFRGGNSNQEVRIGDDPVSGH